MVHKVHFISLALVVLAMHAALASDFCVQCLCPVEFAPVCGRQPDTGKLRGFTSICMMDCTNKCRKKPFEFHKKGRCGMKRNPLAYFAEAQALHAPPPNGVAEDSGVPAQRR